MDDRDPETATESPGSSRHDAAVCAFCGVPTGEETFSQTGILYCCEDCYHKARELADTHARLEKAYWQTLQSLVAALDARESKTAMHSRRVAEMTRLLAQAIGCTKVEQDDFYRGALLHDIGKIGIPDSILLKPGPLSEEEWRRMRLHPEIGRRILQDVTFLCPAAEIVLAHQERYDGSGYPRQLHGENIPLGARLFAVADALDAITADRPYRRGQPFETARLEIQRGAGSHFDPQIVEVFQSQAPGLKSLLQDLEGEQTPFDGWL